MSRWAAATTIPPMRIVGVMPGPRLRDVQLVAERPQGPGRVAFDLEIQADPLEGVQQVVGSPARVFGPATSAGCRVPARTPPGPRPAFPFAPADYAWKFSTEGQVVPQAWYCSVMPRRLPPEGQQRVSSSSALSCRPRASQVSAMLLWVLAILSASSGRQGPTVSRRPQSPAGIPRSPLRIAPAERTLLAQLPSYAGQATAGTSGFRVGGDQLAQDPAGPLVLLQPLGHLFLIVVKAFPNIDSKPLPGRAGPQRTLGPLHWPPRPRLSASRRAANAPLASPISRADQRIPINTVARPIDLRVRPPAAKPARGGSPRPCAEGPGRRATCRFLLVIVPRSSYAVASAGARPGRPGPQPLLQLGVEVGRPAEQLGAQGLERLLLHEEVVADLAVEQPDRLQGQAEPLPLPRVGALSSSLDRSPSGSADAMSALLASCGSGRG